ncbi:Hypothetical predicted protein [Mytilus galloprovincialis]|uniref:Temptin Cys/Cys disulfide domain-containing protein n=2 Tax=Mytilus galloprovincialis TaxID=29158 RepID=A0A8B6EG83_MYTGA|nr:Hypothetical predicted protein [Mytilus galloprovincialis]
MMIKFVTLLLVISPMVLSRPNFRDLIPNGYHVPNPCRIPATWNPVGHYNPEHYTNLKNPFGVDFRANGFKWNATICRKDSDGDGMTNGEELGDSNCSWHSGQKSSNPIGHPGICEPVGSSVCHNQHFRCDLLENSPGLQGHQ